MQGILLDTGCSRTLIRKDSVAEEKYLEGEAVTVCCSHGDTVLYPLAKIEMEVEGVKVGVRAAVAERLLVPVLLGTELGHLLQKDPRAAHSEGVVEEVVVSSGSLEDGERSGEFPEDKDIFVEEKGEKTKMGQVGAQSFAVMTQAQRLKQQADDEEQLVKESLSDVQSSPLEEEGNGLEELEKVAEGESPVFGSQFSKDCFQQSRERCNVKTKRQCREERHSHGLVQAKDWPKREESVSGRSLCVDREELCQLQRSDENLAGVRRSAQEKEGSSFFWREGLLLQRW